MGASSERRSILMRLRPPALDRAPNVTPAPGPADLRLAVTNVNVLLITTDQQRADTLGVEGSPLGATPRLDALAGEGTRFAAARTQNPLCQPARATILTGTYPSTHGVTCNGIDLPADAVGRSVASLLARAGFRTALFGKAH